MMGNMFWQLLKKTFSETKFFDEIFHQLFFVKNLVSEKVFSKVVKTRFPSFSEIFFALDNFLVDFFWGQLFLKKIFRWKNRKKKVFRKHFFFKLLGCF